MIDLLKCANEIMDSTKLFFDNNPEIQNLLVRDTQLSIGQVLIKPVEDITTEVQDSDKFSLDGFTFEVLYVRVSKLDNINQSIESQDSTVTGQQPVQSASFGRMPLSELIYTIGFCKINNIPIFVLNDFNNPTEFQQLNFNIQSESNNVVNVITFGEM